MKAPETVHEVTGYVDIYHSNHDASGKRLYPGSWELIDLVRRVEVSANDNDLFFRICTVSESEGSRRDVNIDGQEATKYTLELKPMASPMTLARCMDFIRYMDQLRDRLQACEHLPDGTITVKTSASFSLA